MVLGQTAAPVGRGATEVGVFTGVLYATQSNPPTPGQTPEGEAITNQAVSRVFALPAAEANLQYGLSDLLAFNVHASSAGLQPGLKWKLNRSRDAHVALLPALAFGYGSVGSSFFTAAADGIQHEFNPTATTSFTFLCGAKLLFSHSSGFFAGVGYDLQVNRSLASSLRPGTTTGERQEILSITTGHQFGASLGLDVDLGLVHLRPEVAFTATGGLATNQTVRLPPNETTTSALGGYGFAIFPGFSVSVATPRRARTADEIEEDEANRRRPTDTDETDEFGDDAESAPRRRAPKYMPDDDAPAPDRIDRD